MAHPYPPHHPKISYIGRERFFLTFCTEERAPTFVDAANVDLAQLQILRASIEEAFEITAYCFMPDHLHILMEGLEEGSDLRVFIKSAKQYSGYYFKQQTGKKLWQRYGYEHALRGDIERAATIRYILDNPLRAGLACDPADYPFLGSSRYTVAELVEQALPSDEARVPEVYFRLN
jgi:putative transposase